MDTHRAPCVKISKHWELIIINHSSFDAIATLGTLTRSKISCLFALNLNFLKQFVYMHSSKCFPFLSFIYIYFAQFHSNMVNVSIQRNRLALCVQRWMNEIYRFRWNEVWFPPLQSIHLYSEQCAVHCALRWKLANRIFHRHQCGVAYT